MPLSLFSIEASRSPKERERESETGNNNDLVMLLLSGSSRHKPHGITVTTRYYCDWTEAVEREVEQIIEETGHSLSLLMHVTDDEDSSSDSDDCYTNLAPRRWPTLSDG